MKIYLVILATMLAGCSEFYGYQPPAPIFGQSQSSNPYEVVPREDSKTTRNNVIIIQPIEDHQQANPTFQTIEPELPSQAVYTPKPMSPAVVALLSQADNSSRNGNHEAAVATIERALRIDGRNPALVYKLAVLRLKQEKPRLAEDLAKKAALLSANNRVLKRKSWLLISEARKRQNNLFGAKEAKLKADSI